MSEFKIAELNESIAKLQAQKKKIDEAIELLEKLKDVWALASSPVGLRSQKSTGYTAKDFRLKDWGKEFV